MILFRDFLVYTNAALAVDICPLFVTHVGRKLSTQLPSVHYVESFQKTEEFITFV